MLKKFKSKVKYKKMETNKKYPGKLFCNTKEVVCVYKNRERRNSTIECE